MGAVLTGFHSRSVPTALMAPWIRQAIDTGRDAIATGTDKPIAGEPNSSLANMVRCGSGKVCSRLNYGP